MTDKEAMKLALETHRKNERHYSLAETRYWCEQYKLLAQQAIEALAQPEQEPVADDHQSFIDSLPTNGEDKMFMQIEHWACKSYKRHQLLVRGQAVTAADTYESHIVWAALRWANENTPPAQPALTPLTGQQIRALWEQEAKPERSTANFFTAFARAIEAAHGIKEHS